MGLHSQHTDGPCFYATWKPLNHSDQSPTEWITMRGCRWCSRPLKATECCFNVYLIRLIELQIFPLGYKYTPVGNHWWENKPSICQIWYDSLSKLSRPSTGIKQTAFFIVSIKSHQLTSVTWCRVMFHRRETGWIHAAPPQCRYESSLPTSVQCEQCQTPLR